MIMDRQLMMLKVRETTGKYEKIYLLNKQQRFNYHLIEVADKRSKSSIRGNLSLPSVCVWDPGNLRNFNPSANS